ncbi:MAG TPA: hypothetical protein VG245_05615, partial [Candidatus Dormibacteraeota bacterium]|nr:hypothetical protein [Candidatus Dormibacteraeota bacterium]
VRAILDHLKAQDDVILAILRNMEGASGITPDSAQRAAEDRLRQVQSTEAAVVARTIEEEETEAGLHDAPGPG